MGYQWTDEGWISRDLTFTSEDITEGFSLINDLVYARNPDDQINMVTEERKLIAATFERNNDIIGWHKHETEGEIYSVATVEFQGRSIQALLVDRNIDSSTEELYLEFITPPYQMDSAVFQYHSTPTNQITDVIHLKNQTVSVLVDDARHPSVTLDANGDGVLEWEGSSIQIGQPYTATFVSLPAAPDAQFGTSAPMRKRWNKIYVRIVASAKVHINGKLSPVRHPATPMGEREPSRTEDIFVVNFGWDQFAQITIEQTFPFPTMITGIFGELGVDNL